MLLFFSVVILLILSFTLILVLSMVRITLENLELSSVGNKIVKKYKYKIGLYFLGKVRLLSTEVSDDRISKLSEKKLVKHNIENIKSNIVSEKKHRNKMVWNLIKQSKQKFQIKSFKLKVCVDVESVELTSYIVGLLSIVVPNLIRNNIKQCKPQNYKFEISPLYKNQNYVYLQLSSIINIKVVHIINMLKLIGGMKSEGTSNRRLNVNCYGKY